jgi:sec-independent protein translocase protein TatB
MFDVGFSELVLLSIIGLLVLGPERLPKVARTLGGITRKARSSWLNLKRSIEEEIRAEELKVPLKKFQDDFKSAVSEVNKGVDSARKAVTDLDTPVSSAQKAVPPTTPTPPPTTNGH